MTLNSTGNPGKSRWGGCCESDTWRTTQSGELSVGPRPVVEGVEDDCEKENRINRGLELENYRMCLGNDKKNNQ